MRFYSQAWWKHRTALNLKTSSLSHWCTTLWIFQVFRGNALRFQMWLKGRKRESRTAGFKNLCSCIQVTQGEHMGMFKLWSSLQYAFTICEHFCMCSIALPKVSNFQKPYLEKVQREKREETFFFINWGVRLSNLWWCMLTTCKLICCMDLFNGKFISQKQKRKFHSRSQHKTGYGCSNYDWMITW